MAGWINEGMNDYGHHPSPFNCYVAQLIHTQVLGPCMVSSCYSISLCAGISWIHKYMWRHFHSVATATNSPHHFSYELLTLPLISYFLIYSSADTRVIPQKSTFLLILPYCQHLITVSGTQQRLKHWLTKWTNEQLEYKCVVEKKQFLCL